MSQQSLSWLWQREKYGVKYDHVVASCRLLQYYKKQCIDIILDVCSYDETTPRFKGITVECVVMSIIKIIKEDSLGP